MNDVNLPEEDLQNASPEEIMSALFANMIIQQTNMALMLLGKVPHPETGEIYKDLESAKMFIDQLEMIEVKTKGNLDKREEGLLKQSLAALRMAFVEEIDAQGGADLGVPPASAAAPQPKENPQSIIEAPQAAATPRTSEAPSQPSAPPEDSESRKKFSKKY